MKLQDRDKSLIMFFVTAVIVVVSILYFVKPNYEETQSIEAECVTLQARLNELQQKQAHRDEYLAGIEEYEKAFTDEMAHFAPDLNQEVTIMFLEGIKDNYDFDIKSLSLGQPEQFYTLGTNGGDATLAVTDTAPAEGEEAPAEEGAETAADVTAASSADVTAASSAYECYRADFPISYEGSYDSLKDIVKYVDNFEHRMTVNAIDITYDPDEDIYQGTIDMKCYAIKGPDRPETSMEMSDVEIGNDNIFHGAAGTGSSGATQGMTKYDDNEGASIENNYDFYAMINSATSDVSAKVVGQNGTGKDASVISNSDNNVSTLSFEFYEKDGKNYCKYTLDNSTSYEAEVTSAEDVKLLIQSSSRKNDDDKVGIKVTISNSTSLPVYVKVSGDDSVSPRVDITSKSGAVKVY